MRIYITGCVGSGKSTLARKLSRITGIACTHLDEIMYEPALDTPSGNRKRNPEERDRLFAQIISAPNWIIEDAGRRCFSAGMKSADRVVILSLPRSTLYFRVILRWTKQRLGFEHSIYRPTFSMLRSMIHWINEYDCSPFTSDASSSVILKSTSEINAYIKNISSGS